MALKLLKMIYPNGITGTVFTNNSNGYVLIIQASLNFPYGAGVLYVADENGNAVGDLVKVYLFGISGSISGSNTFSSTATSTTGITSTNESVNETLSSQDFSHQVIMKGLLPPNFKLISYQTLVYGFLAIQADSLEELRGFI